MESTKKRWWDVWAALLLLAAVIVAANRLVMTRWTVNLDLPVYIIVLSTILGLALGQSRFSARICVLLAVLYGLFAIPWVFGVILTSGSVWSERMLGLAGRLNIAVSQFLAARPVKDSVLFLILIAVLYWGVGVSAGYNLTRYASAWATVLPGGVVVLVINHYDHLQRNGFRLVLFYIFFALLLLGRITYLRYRDEWTLASIFQPPETGRDLSQATLVVGAVLILVAWNIPTTHSESDLLIAKWQEFTQPFSLLRQKAANAFSSLSTSYIEATDYYGNELDLGTGSNLGNLVYMTVKAPNNLPTGARYYWWAHSYDQYQNGQWSTTFIDQEYFNPSTFNYTYPPYSGRQEVTLTFYPQVIQMANFYTGSMPLSITRPGEILFQKASDGSTDIAGLTAIPPIRAGESYQSKISLSVPTIDLLRKSSINNYPAWVMRYLQMPADLPASIPQLALQIMQTAGNPDNPYDKTQAITDYLRKNITYLAVLPKPPADKEPLEWFLFDVKEGYCSYYASAEIILLRSLGIPARLSVGYAQGQYNDALQRYVVLQKDAHAWPEVYFAGVGWVEFEPTVSQPARVLPSGVMATGNTNLTPTPAGADMDLQYKRPPAGGNPYANNPANRARNNNWLDGVLLGMGVAIFVVGLGLIFWFYWRSRKSTGMSMTFPAWIEYNLTRRGRSTPDWLARWNRRTRLTPFEKAYAVLAQAGRLLGQTASSSETPTERVARFVELLPEASGPVHILVTEFQQDLFSPQPGNLPLAQLSSHQIRRLAYVAFLRRLLPARR